MTSTLAGTIAADRVIPRLESVLMDHDAPGIIVRIPRATTLTRKEGKRGRRKYADRPAIIIPERPRKRGRRYGASKVDIIETPNRIVRCSIENKVEPTNNR